MKQQRAAQQITIRWFEIPNSVLFLLSLVLFMIAIALVVVALHHRKLYRSCKFKYTELPFIMCLFRYHRNEKLYQFLSLSFDLLRAFPPSLRSPTIFWFMRAFLFPNTHNTNRLHFIRLISGLNHFFLRYFATKLNKYFRKGKQMRVILQETQ